MQFWRLAVR